MSTTRGSRGLDSKNTKNSPRDFWFFWHWFYTKIPINVVVVQIPRRHHVVFVVLVVGAGTVSNFVEYSQTDSYPRTLKSNICFKKCKKFCSCLLWTKKELNVIIPLWLTFLRMILQINPYLASRLKITDQSLFLSQIYFINIGRMVGIFDWLKFTFI